MALTPPFRIHKSVWHTILPWSSQQTHSGLFSCFTEEKTCQADGKGCKQGPQTCQVQGQFFPRRGAEAVHDGLGFKWPGHKLLQWRKQEHMITESNLRPFSRLSSVLIHKMKGCLKQFAVITVPRRGAAQQTCTTWHIVFIQSSEIVSRRSL